MREGVSEGSRSWKDESHSHPYHVDIQVGSKTRGSIDNPSTCGILVDVG